MDPLTIFADLQDVAKIVRKLQQLTDKLQSPQLRLCVAELDSAIDRVKESAEFLASSYDQLLSQRLAGAGTVEHCPECRAKLDLRSRVGIAKHKHIELRTYLCASCGYSSAELYGKDHHAT
jgi:hypothetical protein